MYILDIPLGSCLKCIFVFLDLVGEPLNLRIEGIIGAEVLFGAGFEGVDKAATYDPKH